jgi:hypothetical protein
MQHAARSVTDGPAAGLGPSTGPARLPYIERIAITGRQKDDATPSGVSLSGYI